MRARTVALLLIALCAAAQACAVGFLTQKELVGRDGNTVVVVPAYTYVTVTQRFGSYAMISYRVGDEVRELRVNQGDLDAVQPVEENAAETTDPAELTAFYLERIPFDVYIDEFRATASPDDAQGKQGPAEYRIRIKTCNLVPEVLPLIRFEVQVYFDPAPDAGSDAASNAAQGERGNRLWQLRMLAMEPREVRTAETPVFSAEDIRATAREPEAPPRATASRAPRQRPARRQARKRRPSRRKPPARRRTPSRRSRRSGSPSGSLSTSVSSPSARASSSASRRSRKKTPPGPKASPSSAAVPTTAVSSTRACRARAPGESGPAPTLAGHRHPHGTPGARSALLTQAPSIRLCRHLRCPARPSGVLKTANAPARKRPTGTVEFAPALRGEKGDEV